MISNSRPTPTAFLLAKEADHEQRSLVLPHSRDWLPGSFKLIARPAPA